MWPQTEVLSPSFSLAFDLAPALTRFLTVTQQVGALPLTASQTTKYIIFTEIKDYLGITFFEKVHIWDLQKHGKTYAWISRIVCSQINASFDFTHCRVHRHTSTCFSLLLFLFEFLECLDWPNTYCTVCATLPPWRQIKYLIEKLITKISKHSALLNLCG